MVVLCVVSIPAQHFWGFVLLIIVGKIPFAIFFSTVNCDSTCVCTVLTFPL